MRFKIVLFLIFMFATNQSFAFVTLGKLSSGSCDYTTFSSALSSGESNIRVVKNNFTENIVINNSVNITGGYTNCTEAENVNSPVPTDKTFIFGTAVTGASVVKINLNNTLVTLKNLYIRDGLEDVSVFDGGHGVDVRAAAGTVKIIDTTIANNRSTKGGGIYVKEGSEEKIVRIINSTIFANLGLGFSVGSGFGGGVYCAGTGASVYIEGESEISLNTADSGGGIAAEYGCSVFSSSGMDVRGTNIRKGIMNNHANFNGGGIYLGNESRFRLDASLVGPFALRVGNDKPATLANNTADLKGGGAYVEFNSLLLIGDSLVYQNSATNGGGLYLGVTSRVRSQYSRVNCWIQESCIIISENTADTGGAVYINTNIESSFQNTFFVGNRADIGTVMFIQGISNQVPMPNTIMNSTIYNNGNNGTGGFADFNVFRVTNNSDLRVIHSTIVDNDIVNTQAIFSSISSTLALINSIIHNNSNVISPGSALLPNLLCLITNEDVSISGANVYVEDPGFVNRSSNDYHLRADSFAVDLCQMFASNIDNDGDNFGIDILSVMNIEGVFDAGSDEYNDHEAVYKNGFE